MSNQTSQADLFEPLQHVEADSDRVLRTLASPRCRQLLALLQARDGAVRIEHVASAVAAKEFATDPSNLDDEVVDHAVTSLYHSHVPKLDGLGLVDFDADDQTITTAIDGEQLDELSLLPPVE